jgi:hypothetical protein
MRIIWFTLLGILLSTFITSAIMASKGSFTITLPREQMLNLGLVISDTADFSRPRHEIVCPPITDLWNISEGSIPENVDQIDGEHNGRDYMAMTVYLKNIGDEDLEYTADVDLNEVYNNLDEALRVKIYVNGTPTIYAKRRSAWGGGAEVGTLPFVSASRIISLPPKEIEKNQVDKFTIVAWVEGNDPDCDNDLLGGFVKMTMGFNAVISDGIAPTATATPATPAPDGGVQ